MEPKFEIRFTTNQKILREFYRKIGTGPRYPVVAAMVLFLAAMVLYSLSAGIFSQVAPTFGCCALIFLVVFFLPWLMAWNILRAAKANNGGRVPETVLTVGDTIQMDEGMVHLTLEYAQLKRVLHLKHSYVLMLNRRNGILLDPQGFTKGSFAEFKQHLRSARPDLTIPD